MQCPSCGSEINTGARFCTACGQDLSPQYAAQGVDPPAHAPSTPGLPPVNVIQRAPLPLGKIVPVLFGIVLLALAAWGVTAFMIPAKPDQVCAKYMEAAKSGNFSKCYGLLNEKQLANQPFLTKSWFVKANKDAKITSYQINSSYSEKNTASNLRYTVQTTGNGTSKSSSLNLVNIGTSEKPKWRVDPTPMLFHSSIASMAGAKAWIDGEEVPLQDGKAGIISFQGLKDLKIKWEGPGAKSVEQNFDTLPSSLTLPLEPDDKLQDNIKKTVTGYSQTVFTTLKNLDVAPITPYVKKDSPAWKVTQDKIDEFKESGMSIDTTIEGLTLSNYRFKNNLDTVLVNTKLTMTYKVYTSSSIQEQGQHESATATMTLEKQSDGKWLIVQDNS